MTRPRSLTIHPVVRFCFETRYALRKDVCYRLWVAPPRHRNGNVVTLTNLSSQTTLKIIVRMTTFGAALTKNSSCSLFQCILPMGIFISIDCVNEPIERFIVYIVFLWTPVWGLFLSKSKVKAWIVKKILPGEHGNLAKLAKTYNLQKTFTVKSLI